MRENERSVQVYTCKYTGLKKLKFDYPKCQCLRLVSFRFEPTIRRQLNRLFGRSISVRESQNDNRIAVGRARKMSGNICWKP